MGLFSRRPSHYTSMVPARAGHGKNSLTASGEKITRGSADQLQRVAQQWQRRAFAYYDILPEIKYAAQFYSRALGALELYAAEKDENGEFVPTENAQAIDALERIQDPGGGRSGLLSTYGRLRFLTGEALLCVTTDEESGEEQWEMLSQDELKVTSAGIQRIKAPSLQPENYESPGDDDYEPLDGKTAITYRLWQRHPRFSHLADSTMQGVLSVCEELVLLEQAVRARARSRLAGSGILLINGKMLSAPAEAGTDEDPESDQFMDDLTEAMTTAITEEGTASAVVPLVVRGDFDDIDKVMKHIQLVDPTQLYPETGLRREAVERLAIGLDMPPEVLLGIADANHWTGWLVDEQTWKAHLQPQAQGLIDDLNSSYYRPTLKQVTADWQKFYIAYDATKVINHPDRGKDAMDLYGARAIGKAALRDAKGFDEDDAMTPEELDEALGVAVNDGSLAKYGIPRLTTGGIEPVEGEIQQGDSVGPADTAKAPPPKPAEPAQPEPVVGSAATVQKLLAASDLTLQRAREIAGARLRSKARGGDAELRATVEPLIDGVPSCYVSAKLGRENARLLGAPTERALVAGAREMLAQTLRVWKIDVALAEPLGERIEQHAARTLYDESPAPFPPAFEKYVAGLVAGS